MHRLTLDDIVRSDPRYRIEAYFFIHESLGRAQQHFGRQQHVSGQELCEGARLLALERYGAMARAVLNYWGLHTTADFGAVVYNLIKAGLMSRTDDDRIEDFNAVYSFDDALGRAYDIPGMAG